MDTLAIQNLLVVLLDWQSGLQFVSVCAFVILNSLYSTKKKKMLSWFEDTFKRFSGADNVMRMDQFADALQTDVVCPIFT